VRPRPGNLLRAYASRTTPWGAPWWVYAVAIAAANVVRQLVMPDDVSTVQQVGTFVGMVVGVATVVTLVHHGVSRRRARRDEAAQRQRRP
jgi:hypothetical protein